MTIVEHRYHMEIRAMRWQGVKQEIYPENSSARVAMALKIEHIYFLGYSLGNRIHQPLLCEWGITPLLIC